MIAPSFSTWPFFISGFKLIRQFFQHSIILSCTQIGRFVIYGFFKVVIIEKESEFLKQ